jgi:hypothetical protein
MSASNEELRLSRSLTHAELADWLAGARDSIRRTQENRAMYDACIAALLSEKEQPTGYYLATFKDGRSSRGQMTWWGPDECGYTPYLEQAGVYTKEQAEKLASSYTVPVPVAFLSPHESRMVDPGHSRNRAFWTADDLRAAVDAYRHTSEASNG